MRQMFARVGLLHLPESRWIYRLLDPSRSPRLGPRWAEIAETTMNGRRERGARETRSNLVANLPLLCRDTALCDDRERDISTQIHSKIAVKYDGNCHLVSCCDSGDFNVRATSIGRNDYSRTTCLAPRGWILIEFINSPGIMRRVIRSAWNNSSSVITPERSGARFPAAVGPDTFDY